MSQPKQLSSELLPYDVVFDILTRLPVKSLVRFRCVSKSWNSIITKPIFITTHMNRPKSLSNNNGYLVYVPTREDHYNYYAQHLCTVVCNNDRTLTHLSRFEVPFNAHMVGFCNGMFCLVVHYSNIIYFWNPSIRKFKMLSIRRLTDPCAPAVIGLAYHSQNNDFKILRVVCDRESNVPLAVAEVYTLSTDSWRRFVISLRSIDYIHPLPCLFFNGALHSLANHESDKFILSFDVNDEMFREIVLPQNYLDEVVDDVLDLAFERLAVFKGSLALFVFFLDAPGNSICHIWVMREYGVVESWTKISVLLDSVNNFDGCTDSGELLICINGRGFISYDLESLNENDLGISHSWLIYTADLMENLVLLDQHNEAEMEFDTPLSPERNPLRVKYPSLPSWEVQVTNDSGEGETMIVPRSKHVPYVPWTGGAVEADFVEECYSLIGSMKDWISSSSQSSFAHLNELSHEIDLLRNRVESQASTIRTLEAGGSSDPIPDAAGAITPPADECNLMNTTVQSEEGSSRCVKQRLAPERPSHPSVRESTTLATLRSKSGHLHSGEQITLDDDEEEDEEDMEDTTPLVQCQSKRGRL